MVAMAMVIKGKNPDKGSLEKVTSTTIDGGEDPDREALDVNIKNANDIEVKMTGEGIAQDATLKDNSQKTQVIDGTNTVFTETHPGKVTVENEDPISVNQGALDKDTDDISTYKAHSSVKIIDNTTITATNTPSDIDFSQYNNFVVTYKLGAGEGGTPTLTITLRVKDSNDNVISDTDYATSALAASSSGIAFKGYMESYGTIQVLCTLGGTGTFAASTVAIEMKT